MRKVILIILDGLGYGKARDYLGNVEGWVASGEGRVWKMRSVLPSTSGPCYASIHTGMTPQEHGVLTNYEHLRRVGQPDIFSAARAAGRTTGAVAHSFFSTYFQRAPFDPVRDLEVDDESLPIQHGRFYTMASAHGGNLSVPDDRDLFAQVTVADYLFDRDKIYAYVTLDDNELFVYQRLYDLLARDVPAPDVVIHLQAPADVLWKRLRHRARAAGEPLSVDEATLREIADAYNHFFFHYSATPLLVVETSHLDLSWPDAAVDEVLHQLQDMPGGTRYVVPRTA